jgi:CheY-like chemotaxis protein
LAGDDQRVRVLLAEDDPSLRHLYSVWLEGSGHRVCAAADGREALAALDGEGVPDVAVLDVTMPHVDGLEVCRRLRARSRDVRIVVVSARDDVREDALAAGASEVLGKPAQRSVLLGALAA